MTRNWKTFSSFSATDRRRTSVVFWIQMAGSMKIVAISDQHGFLPDIPACDLLIVAGDQCPDYPSGAMERVGSGPQIKNQRRWFETVWMTWRRKQPAALCLVTGGNHDYALEVLGEPRAQTPLGDNTVLCEDCLYRVGDLRVWLTPWSTQFRDWAFMATEEEVVQKYQAIPAGVDILVSHQPPAMVGDRFVDVKTKKVEHLGSKVLRAAIVRVQPKVVVCGHIHSGRGVGPIGPTQVYNVSILNERYEHVHPHTVIEL